MTAPRRTVGNITLTLDGRITGPGGNQDMGWVVPHAFSDVVRDGMVETVAAADTVLIGRTNFEGFRAVWPAVAGLEGADPRDRAFSAWLNGVRKVLFSTTVTDPAWAGTEVTTEAPASVVRRLRQTPGGDLVVLASISILTALLEAGELDRLVVTYVPEILGGGRRFLDQGELPASGWTLSDHQVSDSGALVLRYDRRD